MHVELSSLGSEFVKESEQENEGSRAKKSKYFPSKDLTPFALLNPFSGIDSFTDSQPDP